MAKFKLAAGADLELLTKDEVREAVHDVHRGDWVERARGIKFFERSQAPANQVGVSPAISATAAYPIPHTPNEGYVWALRGLYATVSAAASLVFTKGDTGSTAPTNLPLGGSSGAASTNPWDNWSNVQAVLRSGQYVVVSASASVSLLNYLLVAVEVPAELIWKLV